MHTFHWVMLVVIVSLIFNRSASSVAIILTITYLAYEFFVVRQEAVYYYSLTAQLNLLAGLALHNKNKRAAICSYLLVPVNVLGFWLWYKYLSPTLYDNISLSILVIQVITIMPKGLLNGIRNYFQPFVVGTDGFDSIESRVTIQKRKVQKGKKQ